MWKWLALAALSADPQFGLSTGGLSDAGRVPRPRPQQQPPPPPRRACDAQSLAPDRGCTRDFDCVLVRQSVGCCGTIAAFGVNRADVERFQAQHRACDTGARCKCAPGPIILDDGARLDGNEPIGVACRANACSTFLSTAPPKLTSESVRRLPRCDQDECGPSPAYPSWGCPDGVSMGGPGPCVRIGGRCGWARLECP